MKLKTLYSRRSDGKPQLWEIEIIDNKYRTIVGIVDGEKVTSEWTTCSGKNIGRSNETTPEEQALTEATAKAKKKKEEGYFEDIKDIDNELFFSPMLAYKYEDCIEDIKFPVFSQQKLDGVRMELSKAGAFSRKGKQFVSIPHIVAASKEFFNKHPNIVLDGELYSDKLANDFNKIISLVKKTKPTEQDLLSSKNQIFYYIYDLYDKDNPNMTYSERYKLLKSLDIFKNTSFKLVNTDIANSQEELDKYYDNYLANDYEGQMIRLDKKYENKRTRSLIKRKEFIDSEFTIKDIEEGVGNKSGCAGAAHLEIKGKPFKANFRGTIEYLREMWKNKKEYIGKEATVRYQRLTPDGIPRFPRVVTIRDYE